MTAREHNGAGDEERDPFGLFHESVAQNSQRSRAKRLKIQLTAAATIQQIPSTNAAQRIAAAMFLFSQISFSRLNGTAQSKSLNPAMANPIPTTPNTTVASSASAKVAGRHGTVSAAADAAWALPEANAAERKAARFMRMEKSTTELYAIFAGADKRDDIAKLKACCRGLSELHDVFRGCVLRHPERRLIQRGTRE